MMSEIPLDMDEVKSNEINKEVLRTAIIAELDAINLYEQLAAKVESDSIRKILLEVAKEEKTHVGEFQALLLRKDKEQVQELAKGRQEVEELTGK